MEEAGLQGMLPNGKNRSAGTVPSWKKPVCRGCFFMGKTGRQGLLPLLSGSGIEPQRVHRFSIYMKKTHKNNTIPF
jgi:hypothetical protein